MTILLLPIIFYAFMIAILAEIHSFRTFLNDTSLMPKKLPAVDLKKFVLAFLTGVFVYSILLLKLLHS